MAYESQPLRRQRVRYSSENEGTPIRAQLVRDGEKVDAQDAAITIYAPTSETAIIEAEAMTVSGSICSYEIDTTDTSDWPIGNGYRADITITDEDNAESVVTVVFDVVRYMLHVPVGRDQLVARDDRIRGLDHDGDYDFSEIIEACRDELQLLLETKATSEGRVIENMVLDPSRLATVFRLYVLRAIFSGKGHDGATKQYDDLFKEMWPAYLQGIEYDVDQDGAEDPGQGRIEPTRLRV